ncbi:polysaccharide pyruvyl transferase family protein [Halomonas alimentaria]|uniref:polysaccharide pyruvyl transferase family protein n=1 Tax=Halomonas alimentaria TaxID=147248 RepID=UPI0024912D0B|nr:polysaccharide pyruvyl transferase family protein [Halomonas alimentaria]
MVARVFNKVRRLARDMAARSLQPKSIPVVYFTDRPNVGDLLNEYIIPKITGRKIIKVSSSAAPHLRAVGSVIGSSSRFSHVWGSGSIDGEIPARRLDYKKIYALRGENTRKLISCAFGFDLSHIPLGDPALLMPEFYSPSVIPGHTVGIVAHFSDELIVEKYIKETLPSNIKLISVGQEPEKFVLDMLSCKYILSSSLHGLILADAYRIPNRWIKMSDRLLGGEFKFHDYYSTTDALVGSPVTVANARFMFSIADRVDEFCRVNNYLYRKEELMGSFPTRYLGACNVRRDF